MIEQTIQSQMQDEQATIQPEADFAGMAETTPEAFLKIKYNGEEMELSMEEAKNLAQKGMNYDHVYEELAQMRQRQPAPEKMVQELTRLRTQEAEVKKWQNFFDNHKEVKDFHSLPEEVKSQVAAGQDIEQAYLTYENTRLKTELEARAHHDMVKDIAPGAVATEGEGEAMDAFQRAFLANL